MVVSLEQQFPSLDEQNPGKTLGYGKYTIHIYVYQYMMLYLTKSLGYLGYYMYNTCIKYAIHIYVYTTTIPTKIPTGSRLLSINKC